MEKHRRCVYSPCDSERKREKEKSLLNHMSLHGPFYLPLKHAIQMNVGSSLKFRNCEE